MIYYLTGERLAGSIEVFLTTPWGRPLAPRITTFTYQQIFALPPAALPRGTYIFTGLSRALGSIDPPSPRRLLAARLRQELVERFGPGAVLNDPQRSLKRYALLQVLRERGLNDFAAHRADALPASARFPLFLREEHGTLYEKTALLANRAAYEAALARAGAHDGLLAIEYCDTADTAGVYRKYGAFVVGDRIVPRHLFFSRDWMVKWTELTGAEQLAEEMAYIESNPHAAVLREVCALANIQYGRVDYALSGGRVQVWEINTTPAVTHPEATEDPVRYKVHQRFAELFAQALDAVDIGSA